MDKRGQILVILTGGTICSATNAEGHRYSSAKTVKILDAFQKSRSPYRETVDFVTQMPMDILSENMTVAGWNCLLDTLRAADLSQYQGVIVLHGTDTLAYTAALLSISLAGIPIPLVMVSSQLPLGHKATNGHHNFRSAVELIMNGIAPNVYAVYRNSDGITYVHQGAHLLSCPDYSDDFYSRDPMVIGDTENACLDGIPFETDRLYLHAISPLSPCVLQVNPYVGLDYDALRLDGVQAVVHSTYHSQTVCVEEDSSSILDLLKRCKEQSIPLILAPCSKDAFQYVSTGKALAQGAFCVWGLTREMAYVKTLVGCAIGLTGEKLQTFLNTPINHEVNL